MLLPALLDGPKVEWAKESVKYIGSDPIHTRDWEQVIGKILTIYI